MMRIGGVEVSLSDLGLILLAAAVLCFALFIRARRMQAYEDRLKQGIRTEQRRVSPSASGHGSKIGKSMAELETGGFHASDRYVFEDKDKQAPVHVEFVVDQAGQTVAYSLDGINFERRTFLQMNGCEIKELREYSSMVDEINLGLSSKSGREGTVRQDSMPVAVESGWMEKAAPRINSLQVILYTGRLMDAPAVLELFGRPHNQDYERYADARRFAVDVQDAVRQIISSRVG
jgi:hypothetical protein